MKTLAKWILAGLGFALGVMAAEHCDAYTIRQVRSLNAATVAGAGVGFTTQANPFYVPGGGLFWTVVITLTANPQITFQIETQMTDGTWTPIIPAITQSSNASVGVVYTYRYSFRGPLQDLRVNMTTRTVGSMTADIYVEY